jgi:hypothetical protein
LKFYNENGISNNIRTRRDRNYHRDFLIKFFLFTEFACAVHQPGPCETITQILSKNMTCARPRCNAMPSEDFPHTSHLYFTFHTSFHLGSCKLFSPHLSSSHLTPLPFTCHLRTVFSTIFISSEH